MRYLNSRSGLLGLLALLLAQALPLAGQSRGPGELPRGTVSGSVLDAESSRPIAGATVVIEPDPAGALPAAGEGAFLRGSQAVASDSAGGYRFESLAPGSYRLRVSRLGYHPATVRVELRGWADSRVSVGLAVEPIPLESVEVTAERPQPYGRDHGIEAEVEGSRVAAARARQRSFLSTDARELTHADVVESVTLGETDLFRSFQRLPGVSTRDDYTAELWTRGAPGDQTRVYFDGVPLFNPMHGMGVFSAVNPDAVGGAVLHPGARPASLGEGAAGVVDVASRRGGGEGEVRGTGDLSLASARLALDQRVLDGRGAWMVAGRRSYLDWITGAVGRVLDDPEIGVPYSFTDLTARFDLGLGEGRSLETSGLWEEDRIAGTIPDVMHRTAADWGNAAGRVSYLAPLGDLRARWSLGYSRYGARMRPLDPDSAAEGEYSARAEPPGHHTFDHLALSAELTPAGAFWRAGAELSRQSADADLPPLTQYSGYAAVDGLPVKLRTSRLQATLWGERRFLPAEGLSVEAGVRVDAGEPLAGAGVLRAAPRLSLRWDASPDLALSLGVGRSWQYAQTIGPAGPSFSRPFQATRLWLHADEETPAIRSDIATVGAEQWLGADWLLSANAYLRRATGIALPDPTPGFLRDRPLFVEGVNTAHGFEVAARRLAGRWTASGSYSYGVSEMEAAGLRFPAPADRRHSVDLTTMVRAGSSLRLGAAFTGATGSPFTRVYDHSWSCGGGADPTCEEQRLGEPNAQRTPAYASLDLLVDWTKRFRAWDLSAYLQLHNALWNDNSTTYSYTQQFCPGRGYTAMCETGYVLRDAFEQGLPILPVFGFRVRF